MEKSANLMENTLNWYSNYEILMFPGKISSIKPDGFLTDKSFNFSSRFCWLASNTLGTVLLEADLTKHLIGTTPTTPTNIWFGFECFDVPFLDADSRVGMDQQYDPACIDPICHGWWQSPLYIYNIYIYMLHIYIYYTHIYNTYIYIWYIYIYDIYIYITYIYICYIYIIYYIYYNIYICYIYCIYIYVYMLYIYMLYIYMLYI